MKSCLVSYTAAKKKRVDTVGSTNGTSVVDTEFDKDKDQEKNREREKDKGKEKDHGKDRNNREERSTSVEDKEQGDSPMSTSMLTIREQNGFDKGYEAEKILGASDSNGVLYFLLKFKEADQAEMVPAAIANTKIPQMVIKFYEERLSWYSDSEE